MNSHMSEGGHNGMMDNGSTDKMNN
jgi:hypothetical protein